MRENREIKFRAWDNGMYFDVVVVDDTWTDDLLRDHWHSGNIMQFTGLKDKNGKDGYDSDLIKDPQGRIWLIVWDTENAKFARELQGEERKMFDGRIGKYRASLQGYLLRECEIIGNIYETPSLLKEGTKTDL